jgi:hypothetical protein
MTMACLSLIVNEVKRKENAMATNTFIDTKVIRIRRMIVIGLMIILGIAVTTGFVWMQTDQVIASPGLRLMDGLWRLFICRCPL